MELLDYEREHLAVLRDSLAECTVLLKSDGSFPIETAGELALYGSGARQTVKGGTGSGEVNSRFFINVEDGLPSDIVMRLKRDPNRDIIWIVTSSAIAYMTPDYKVTTVNKFPYTNNFDMFENSKGDMWILSSNGIYVVAADELLANGDMRRCIGSKVLGFAIER